MYYDTGPAHEEVEVEHVYGDKVVKSMMRRCYLPHDDPRYIDSSPGYQSESVGQMLGFGETHGDEPSSEEYFNATGLRRLLLAELAQQKMGLFTSTERKRFLPIGSANYVANFVSSIGDNYGPPVHWLPKSLRKYGKATNPSSFLNKPSHKCYVTFEASFSRGNYGRMILCFHFIF